MIRRPPRSTRTDTLFPYTPLFRSQVGTLAAMQLPAGTKHIDLPGETLLPGLIDMHVHLTSLAEVGGYQGLKYTDSFWQAVRSEEHTSELQSLMRISYAVFCLKKKKEKIYHNIT